MNDNAFDIFTRRAEAVSRRGSLRTLGAALAAFAGVTRTAEPGAARKKNQKLRTVCHCPDETVSNCRTLKKAKKSVKKHLKKHQCDYKGRCKDFNPCQCIANTPPFGGPQATCTADSDCCGTGSCCDFGEVGLACYDLLTNQTACGTSCATTVNCLNIGATAQCVNGACVG